jgi:hypothetical protein
MSTINRDEHDAQYGARSGPEQPLAPKDRDKPGASSYQQGNLRRQGIVCEQNEREVSANKPERGGDEQSRPRP